MTRTAAEHGLLAVCDQRQSKDRVDDMQPSVRGRIYAKNGSGKRCVDPRCNQATQKLIEKHEADDPKTRSPPGNPQLLPLKCNEACRRYGGEDRQCTNAPR